MTGVMLQSYLIDTVQAVEVAGIGEVDGNPVNVSKVQMITYKVLAQTPDHALKRFTQEGAGVIVYQGDIVDKILIGMNVDSNGVYDV